MKYLLPVFLSLVLWGFNDPVYASPVELRLKTELRLSKKPVLWELKQNLPYQINIPYSSVSLDYNFSPFSIYMKLKLNHLQNQWLVNLSDLKISYVFKKIILETGWLTLPLGYMDQDSHLFLTNLSLYSSLSRNKKDFGGTVQLNLWKQNLFLITSLFTGYLKREGESSHRAPGFAPIIVSLKTQGSFGNGFASWFKKDLAFFNPLQALGGGFHFTRDIAKFTTSLQGELWHIRQKNQTNFSYYLFPGFKFNKWKIGVVFGEMNYFSPHWKAVQVKSSLQEGIVQISYQVHPYIILTAEKFTTQQKKGVRLNDLWGLRLKTEFDF